MRNGGLTVLREFWHREEGDPEDMIYYDVNGVGFISAEDLVYYRKQGYNDTDLENVCIKYKDLVEARRKEIEEEKEKVKIRNIKELMGFMYKRLDKDKKREIKEAVKRGESLEELINRFPVYWRSILRMRLAQDRREEEKEKAIIKGLAKGLTKEVPVYDDSEIFDDEVDFNNPFV